MYNASEMLNLRQARAAWSFKLRRSNFGCGEHGQYRLWNCKQWGNPRRNSTRKMGRRRGKWEISLGVISTPAAYSQDLYACHMVSRNGTRKTTVYLNIYSPAGYCALNFHMPASVPYSAIIAAILFVQRNFSNICDLYLMLNFTYFQKIKTYPHKISRLGLGAVIDDFLLRVSNLHKFLKSIWA